VVRYLNLEEQVDRDFTHACRRALLRQMRARLISDPDAIRLLSFDKVRKALRADNRIYLRRRVVPVEKMPLGRLARPDDLAAAAPFYASDLSAFTTRTSLTIDGGANRAIA
jgi:NAD(P)-dependent dehydrogenase (short-subunit alcohol dehydrogenase family)